jgi:cob(I)alamin adenosyltransferase
MTPTLCNCSEIATIATHTEKIATLEEAVKSLANKLDRLQWLLASTLAAALVNLAVLLARR